MNDEGKLRARTDEVVESLHAIEGILFDARSAIDLAYFAATKKHDPVSAKRAVKVALRELECLGSALTDTRDRCRALHGLIADSVQANAHTETAPRDEATWRAHGGGRLVATALMRRRG